MNTPSSVQSSGIVGISAQFQFLPFYMTSAGHHEDGAHTVEEYKGAYEGLQYTSPTYPNVHRNDRNDRGGKGLGGWEEHKSNHTLAAPAPPQPSSSLSPATYVSSKQLKADLGLVHAGVGEPVDHSSDARVPPIDPTIRLTWQEPTIASSDAHSAEDSCLRSELRSAVTCLALLGYVLDTPLYP